MKILFILSIFKGSISQGLGTLVECLFFGFKFKTLLVIVLISLSLTIEIYPLPLLK